jgi:DNA gyrase/topoisomerase IV subunit B
MSENFLLKELTSESKKRINELILNEKLCQELEKNGEGAEGLLQKIFNKTRKSEKEASNIVEESNEPEKLKPDKLLEAGKKLPKKYARHFPSYLRGVPLEEIDDFYKNDHVICFC